MKENGVTVPDAVDEQMTAQESLGHTAVLAAINGRLHSCTVVANNTGLG